MRQNIVIDIVDDHKMVVGGLQDMLSSLPNITLGNTYMDGNSLLKGLQKKQPDILMLDIELTDVRGDELAAIISKAYPAIKIIAITGYNTIEHARLMLNVGVPGYLLKNTDEHKLSLAIDTVYRGGIYIEPSIEQRLHKPKSPNGHNLNTIKPMLTRREKDLLRLIMEQMTGPEMAKELKISLRTVDNHKVSLMQKLGAKNLAGIVKRAYDLGLTDE